MSRQMVDERGLVTDDEARAGISRALTELQEHVAAAQVTGGG
jgi:hypothetical protein